MGNRSIINDTAMLSLCLGTVILTDACTRSPPPAPPAPPMPGVTVNTPPAPGADATKAKPAASTVSQAPDITFFDADAFDSSLGQAFADQPSAVHVEFAAPTSLNSIPPRINVWLTEIKKSNGRVEMASVDPNAPPGKRGLGISMIFDIIDAVITWQERQARAKQLDTSHAYDATIIYDKKTGVAKEVLFARRGT